MPTQDLIQVQVLVDDEEAIEYEDPNAIDEDNKCVRYIETTPGQKFSVKVTWLAGFRIRWAEALYCNVCKGDETWVDAEWRSSRDLEHDRGTLSEAVSLNLSSTIMKDPKTLKNVRCEWAFEGVEMVDDAHDSINLDTTQVQSLGSLHVTVFRAKRVKLDACEAQREKDLDDMMIPSQRTELAGHKFKGNDVKQTIKYVDPKPTMWHGNSTRDILKCLPRNGPSGETHHFVFKHRDKKALQSIGCLPRSSTPPPDPIQLLEHFQRTAEVKKRDDAKKDQEMAEMKREMQSIKRKMALLLSGRTAEPVESSVEEAASTPATSPSEANDTDTIRSLREITNPNPKPRPEDIIDLTGDSDSD